MLRSILLSSVVSSLVLLAACASGGGASRYSTPAQAQDALPARVVFRHAEQNVEMALVNDAHTDRVELYSQARRDYSTKVTENEVMDALVEYLYGESRFMRYAQPGPAPRSGYHKYGEAELPNGTFHWAVHKYSPHEELLAFVEWQTNFLALWNQVAQLQSSDGNVNFTVPELTPRQRNAGKR